MREWESFRRMFVFGLCYAVFVPVNVCQAVELKICCRRKLGCVTGSTTKMYNSSRRLVHPPPLVLRMRKAIPFLFPPILLS